MEFKIAKKEFLNALNIVSRAVSTNTPLPALTGILIDVKEKEITLTASDSNISIKTVLSTENTENQLTIYSTGSIAIDVRYIVEIVRKIDSELLTFELMDGTLSKIVGQKSEFKINGFKAIDYPEISFEITSEPFVLETSVFDEIVEQTSFACSDKETRPALTGVNFSANGNILKCTATDSYRLAVKEIPLEKELQFNITIPSKHLIEVRRSITNERVIDIAIDAQKISFVLGNTIIQTRLIDDAYPDTSRLIPSGFTQVLEVNSRELLDAIDRSFFIKSDSKNVVKLSITEEAIDITTSNQEIGSSFEKVSIIEYKGSPLSISCSGKYLADAIKALKSEIVMLNFSGELKPIIIKKKEDENITQLISPVRTYN